MELFQLIMCTVCVCGTIIHFIVMLVLGLRQGKRLAYLCDKCGMPVFDKDVHSCALTPVQLDKLYSFVRSVEKSNKGGE